MPIFDEVIFDGTTGGSIFDDGGATTPTFPPTSSITVPVRLERITLTVILAATTMSLNLEGGLVTGTTGVEDERVIEDGELRVIEDGEGRITE